MVTEAHADMMKKIRTNFHKVTGVPIKDPNNDMCLNNLQFIHLILVVFGLLVIVDWSSQKEWIINQQKQKLTEVYDSLVEKEANAFKNGFLQDSYAEMLKIKPSNKIIS